MSSFKLVIPEAEVRAMLRRVGRRRTTKRRRNKILRAVKLIESTAQSVFSQ
jgi:hypothetical protein